MKLHLASPFFYFFSDIHFSATPTFLLGHLRIMRSFTLLLTKTSASVPTARTNTVPQMTIQQLSEGVNNTKLRRPVAILLGSPRTLNIKI